MVWFPSRVSDHSPADEGNRVSYTLIAKAERTSRKPHRCIWCGQQISPGDRYMHERSVYAGNPQSHDWHPECDAACQEEFSGEGQFEFEPFVSERPEQEGRAA